LECWHDTVARVVQGAFRMQQRHMVASGLGWSAADADARARVMFDKIFHMKFLPPGRGLWAMGSPMTEERATYAALNNCGFVSTGGLAADPAAPFCWLMDAAMLGVGVGFDTLGAGALVVVGPARGGGACHRVGDSREGWVESLRALLEAHFLGRPLPTFVRFGFPLPASRRAAPTVFTLTTRPRARTHPRPQDYAGVRPRGAPIAGFGGVASGPEVLARLHNQVHATLAPLAGKPLTVTALVDLMNQIGRCVVSGEVRQTAEIAFGDPACEEYVALKDYRANPGRAEWGWTSNNSVFAPLGMDYGPLAARVAHNGEPGFAWLENMRAFGRMGDPPTWADARAAGGNPCLEQTLEPYELCCLVETFPAHHATFEEFADTLRSAFLYAKIVTLGATHWPATNRVMLRNRRVGTSLSGVAQFVAKRGLANLKSWCERGYAVVQAADREASEAMAVPRSVKTTCIKPSGTVSLLAGATPGMHFPEARFYLRRVRLGKDHDLLPALRAAGYGVEPAREDPERKVVVAVPVDAGEGVRTLDTVSMWEQFATAAFLQRHWADNQVSCTITFDPTTEGPHVAHALDVYQFQLKGVSLLPRAPLAQYPQLPYEAISEETYRRAVAGLRPLAAGRAGAAPAATPAPPDAFCDAAACAV
jgi:adenosylcobalamin-dependent ribonucleoside-triphosphate reductase